MCYYGAGIVGIIIAILTWFTLKEPERQTIGEENTVSANNQNDGSRKKAPGAWRVMIQPRVILLCLAASIRHTGVYIIMICFKFG